MYKYKIVSQWNKVFIAFLVLIVLIISSVSVDTNDNFIHAFFLEYNERRFLLLYLNIHLIGLFPIVGKLLKEEQVSRVSLKCVFYEKRIKEVVMQSGFYAMLLTFGWYFIVGMKLRNIVVWDVLPNILYFFIKIFIGMTEISALFLLLYCVLKNMMFAYIISYGLLIMTNFSLFINEASLWGKYTRVFQFVFTNNFPDEIYREISIGSFHIFISILLFFVAYIGFKKHDYLKKGHEQNEGK